MKDLEKRKRVMQRSMQLGHCICAVKRACPCDVLRDKDVCPCAGERLEEPARAVPLTQLVENPGCASKIDRTTLTRVLRGLPFADDRRVLVGAPAGDDAGVFRLDENTALVQTVDVFSPAVDDPYQFGLIAAANSLSDVYAMGGRPLTALSIVGFPVRSLADDCLREILRGGIDKMAEAGVPIIGGHSIDDAQIKAGFAVTGLVHPQRIISNAGARPGDRLILTKPLGTGIIAFAAQLGRVSQEALQAAARSMAALNRRASELMIECGATACTDVTGFGLAGHLAAMMSASSTDAELIWDDLPLLPGVLKCLAEEIIPGAVERNREAAADALLADASLSPSMQDILFDPQTSGGLLIAVAESAAAGLLARLRAEGIAEAAIIGQVRGPGAGRIVLHHAGRRLLPRGAQGASGGLSQFGHHARRGRGENGTVPIADTPTTPEVHKMSCCSEGHESPAEGAGQIRQMFQEFLKSAAAPGALDGRTKRAIAIALSVLAKCEPCLKIHVQKAREMGFSQDEIDEAAWLAIAFGGSPTMMFYKENLSPHTAISPQANP